MFYSLKIQDQPVAQGFRERQNIVDWYYKYNWHLFTTKSPVLEKYMIKPILVSLENDKTVLIYNYIWIMFDTGCFIL